MVLAGCSQPVKCLCTPRAHAREPSPSHRSCIMPGRFFPHLSPPQEGEQLQWQVMAQLVLHAIPGRWGRGGRTTAHAATSPVLVTHHHHLLQRLPALPQRACLRVPAGLALPPFCFWSTRLEACLSFEQYAKGGGSIGAGSQISAPFLSSRLSFLSYRLCVMSGGFTGRASRPRRRASDPRVIQELTCMH